MTPGAPTESTTTARHHAAAAVAPVGRRGAADPADPVATSVTASSVWGRPVPSTYVEADEALGVLLDAVVVADRQLAAVAARRAGLIDQVRRWSRLSVDALARGRGREGGSVADHRIAERSTTAELACALRVPEGTATVLVEESRALVHDLPATMTALSQGALSYRHAQVVMSATAALDEGATATLDAELARRGASTTVANLGRVARRARERHDRRPLVDRHAVASVERRVELEAGRDGMAWLHQLLPAVQATAIFHRLSDIASACQGPGEERTLAQLRADACVELLLDDDARTAAGSGSVWTTPQAPGQRAHTTTTAEDPAPDEVADDTSSGQDLSHETPASSLPVSLRGIRPVVAVTVPVMTLLGHSEEPGDLTGYGPIDATTARELAAHAPTFIRLLTHPETGTILSVGRDKYTVPADLRTWLQIRDQTCRFPGCSRRAARCDIDHITPWAHTGTTTHTNLIHLCRKHHRLKHTTRWTPRLTTTHGDADSDPGTGSGSADTTPQEDARPPCTEQGRLAEDRPQDAVVHWTAPSGRSYGDVSAVALPAPGARSIIETSRVLQPPEPPDREEPAPQSIFDGPPPF